MTFQLQQVRRNTDKFEVKIISTVSFSRFILPTDEEVSSRWFSHPPAKHIPALQFLSTVAIRKLIRENIKNRQQIRMRSVVRVYHIFSRIDLKILKFNSTRDSKILKSNWLNCRGRKITRRKFKKIFRSFILY